MDFSSVSSEELEEDEVAVADGLVNDFEDVAASKPNRKHNKRE